MHDKLTNPNAHIVIIGGTSGIGLTLATAYLLEGWQVSIVGSDANKIVNVKQNIADKYPKQFHNLTCYQCDISQKSELDELFILLQKKPFNHLIYCAGWYLNERKQKLNKADSQKMLAVNLQAFNQVFLWASEQLKQYQYNNKKMVCIASVAGMIDYPNASLYAKCKKAMIVNSQAYNMALTPFNIKVICVAPGYVDTQALRQVSEGKTDNKPFIIDEQKAVNAVRYAINHNLVLYCFPKPMQRITTVLNALPKSILNKVMGLQYRKQDKEIS